MRVALIRKKDFASNYNGTENHGSFNLSYDGSSRSFGRVITPFLDLKCPVSLHAQKLGGKYEIFKHNFLKM